MSTFNLKHCIGLLVLSANGAVLYLQTDKEFTSVTLSRLCSKAISCITSYCSTERSISGVICNFAMLLFSTGSPLLKLDEAPLFIFYYACVLSHLSSQFRYNHCERFAVRSQHFSGHSTWRRGLTKLHYLTSCK